MFTQIQQFLRQEAVLCLAVGVTLLAILLWNFRLLMQVDYSLLVTFVGFFIFIGNISHL